MLDRFIVVQDRLRADPRSAQLGSSGRRAGDDRLYTVPIFRHAAGINKQTIEHLIPSDVTCHINPVYYFNKVA
jgi:hypothetical protein